MSFDALIAALRDELGVHVDPTVVIMTMALLMARILPVIIFTPFLGGEAVPSEVKIGLGVTLGVVMFPLLADRMDQIPTGTIAYVVLMAKELFVGLALSFIVGMVFYAAEVAGSVMDTAAGTNMAQVHVPQIQQQTSIFASLQLQLSVVLFITLNGHHVVIKAFADSLIAIPLDTFPHFSSGLWSFFELIARVFADLMRIALALAAPALISAVLTDFALGIINRVAPQVQVYFISMQIKPLVVVLMLLTVMSLVLQRMSLEFGELFQWLEGAIRLMA